MTYKTTTSLVIISLLVSSEALRILVCYPMTTKSHSILGHGVVNRLLEAGHEVVHITSFPNRKVVPKLREVDVSSIVDALRKNEARKEAMKLKNIIGKENFADSAMFLYVVYSIHKSMLEEPNVVKLLSDPNEKFDAVILEWFFTELNAGIPALFECPLIWVCSTEPHWHALRVIDGITNPAYTLGLFAQHKLPLTFWQRADGLWKLIKKNVQLPHLSIHYGYISMEANTSCTDPDGYQSVNVIAEHGTPNIISMLDRLIDSSSLLLAVRGCFKAPHTFEKWAYNRIYPEIAAKRGVTMPPYEAAVYNGSFMFLNAHPSIGGAMKLPQNTLNIAGYHIDKTKPLPKDLQKLMDEAKDGVIYFSMGTVVDSEGMSDEMKRSLLNMFSKYKQTIIWKFESDMTDIPANVHLVKWAPQPSILAHPNLRLFITHGGQLSTTEAIHYGVPLVGVPIMADQVLNMRSVETKGFGIIVTLAEDMVPELDAAVRKILTDDTFKNRAKELSALFHDREMPPGDALAHWVQYVVRNHGARHLRSPALDVPLYQKLYLDLGALLAVIIVLVKKAVMYVQRKRSNKQNKEKTS